MDKKVIKEILSLIGDARSTLEQLRDEEQEKFDDKSDNWKESDKGQEVEGQIAELSEAVDILEGAEGVLGNLS